MMFCPCLLCISSKIFKYKIYNILKKFNPFVPDAPFLNPLKTSENLTVF